MAARKPAARKATARATPEGPPWLEWLMAGLGLLLVLGALAVIGRDIVAPGGPAVIETRVASVQGRPGDWRAGIEVRNTGGATASAVQIEGQLGEQTAAVTLDYVPAGGQKTIVLGFESDPRTGLKVRALGWVDP
jgi:uncharacterized protein (TIGR02588 family)